MHSAAGWKGLFGLALVIFAGPLVAEEPAPTLSAALKAGQPVVELRYRFEGVSDDAVGEKEARASTLRTLIGYKSGSWRGFAFWLEAENVAALGQDLYNNGGVDQYHNGVRDRPVVADPAGTEIQRALLSWKGEKLKIGVGRDAISLGDERFVGPVGWRQNHQSFDAVTIDSSALGRVSLFYGFLDSVQRINRTTDAMASHLANAKIDLGPAGGLTLYGYWLDYDDPARTKLSTATYGAEWAGGRDLAHGRLLSELEWAQQSDHADNPSRVDADYAFLMLGLKASRITVKGSYERLGGSSEDGQFNTPLATLHKFNGWADKFLVTPVDGLVDRELQVSGAVGAVNWLASYHDFRAATGNANYGTELDLQLLYRSPARVTFGLKAALYQADQFAADTEKWMLWSAYSL